MTHRTFDDLVSRVRLAISQGIQPRLNSKGSSGSYFARDAAGATLGIFKPADEEPYGRLNPKLTKWVHRNFLSRVIPFGRSCLIPQLSYLSEAAASLVDRRLETNIVPRTEVVAFSSPAFFYDWIDRERSKPGPNRRELPEKDGSFQVFLNGYQDASLFLRNHPYPGRSLSQTLDVSPRRRKRINLLAPFNWMCGRAEAEEVEEEEEDDEEAGWGWGGEDGSETKGREGERGGAERFKWTDEMMESFRGELEKLVLLDYLIRNTDRGLDNFMIRGCVCSHPDSSSPPTRSTTPTPPNGPSPVPPMSTSTHTHTPTCTPHMHIAAIDNSLAFPHAHPSGWRSFTYGWLYLPLSLIGVPFSSSTRAHFLQKLESKEWWEDTARELEELFRRDGGFEEKMWKKQLAVMKGQGWNIVQTLRKEGEGPVELCRRGKRLVWDEYVEIPVDDDDNPIVRGAPIPQSPLQSQSQSQSQSGTGTSSPRSPRARPASPPVSLPLRPLSLHSAPQPPTSRTRSLSNVLSIHVPKESLGSVTGVSMMQHLDRVEKVEMDLKKTFGMLDRGEGAGWDLGEGQRSASAGAGGGGRERRRSSEGSWGDRVVGGGGAGGHRRSESTTSGKRAKGKGKSAYRRLEEGGGEEDGLLNLNNGRGMSASWSGEMRDPDEGVDIAGEVERLQSGKERSRVVIVERNITTLPFRTPHHAHFFVDGAAVVLEETIPEFSISPPPHDPTLSSRSLGGVQGDDAGVVTGLEALEVKQAEAETAHLQSLGATTATATSTMEEPQETDDSELPSYPPSPSPASKSTPPPAPPKAPESRGLFKHFSAESLPGVLQWIPPHWNWKGFRPVVRSAVSAWCGLLLLLVMKSELGLGQASFLILVVATISPPSNPIATVVEQTILQSFLVATSWAWGCLGLFIAHETRTQYKLTEAAFTTLSEAPYLNLGLTAAEISTKITDDIYTGVYLETGASVICGVFLGIGCGAFLWLRGNLGPGPALFGIIFGIILQVIMFTTGVLYPYAFYSLGLIFWIPFICQQAINLACSVLVFPETLSHQFSDRLIATLLPLQSVIRSQREMLLTNPRSQDWLKFKSIKKGVDSAMAGVSLLGASQTNLTREISYARVSGKDLTRILVHMRTLVSRSTGFVSFYETIEKHLHREYSDAKGGVDVDNLVIHLGRSRPNSPEHSPTSTRPNSINTSGNHDQDTPPRASLDNFHLNIPGHSPPQASLKSIHETEDIPHLALPHRTHPLPYNRTFSAPAPHQHQHQHQHSSSPSNPPSPRRNSSSTSLADLNALGASGASGGGTALEEQDHPVDSHLSRLMKKKIHGHAHNRSSSFASLPSMVHDMLQPHGIRPVGLVESQRYMDIEDFLSNPRDEEHLEEIIRLLSIASDPLLASLDSTLGHLMSTIHRLKSSRKTLKDFFYEDVEEYNSVVESNAACLADLEEAMAEYRNVRRLDVVRPFASLFDPAAPKDHYSLLRTPSHRGLFWAFSYQFSLMKWGDAVLEVARETWKVEKKRRRPRFWTPEWAKFKFGYTTANITFEDEDPDTIIGLNPGLFNAPRNPDFKPAETKAQVVGIAIYEGLRRLTKPDVLFGIKSAILLGIVSLPAYFATSCYFFATQRGIWVLIMIALTSTQFVGDTTFGFLMRVIGTFVGAVVGLLVWTIGAGVGIGSAYGIAGTCVVAFPIVFYVRVHYLPPVTAIISAVTVMLCVGYSWQDAHQPTLSSVGYGFDVAWKRFLAVMLGISVAFVWAYVPPKSSQKGTVRRTYAKVLSEMGGVVCQIISFAHYKTGKSRSPQKILQNIGLLRIRVSKTTASKGMIKYEVSLRGAWPAEHYASLQILQMELLDLLVQFLAVISSLPANWSKALLHRSQFANGRFLGEMLTTFQLLSTALADSKPLPMLYNPLLEHYLRPPETERSGHAYGFEPTMEDDIEGIPSHVDLDTICSLEYLQFSCGISIAYSMVNRIDRLMFVTKSLVGESYLVYGLESERNRRMPREELERRWNGDDSRMSSMDNLV